MTPAPQERPGRIEYLYLTPVQKAAKRQLDEAIDDLPANSRLRCRTPVVQTNREGKKFLGYPHMDYDERTPPDPLTALQMCSTAGRLCPVAEECRLYGEALGDVSGVWGGVTFVDGQPLGRPNITNNRR